MLKINYTLELDVELTGCGIYGNRFGKKFIPVLINLLGHLPKVFVSHYLHLFAEAFYFLLNAFYIGVLTAIVQSLIAIWKCNAKRLAQLFKISTFCCICTAAFLTVDLQQSLF
jgi:hypothetical protein